MKSDLLVVMLTAPVTNDMETVRVASVSLVISAKMSVRVTFMDIVALNIAHALMMNCVIM